MADGACVTCGAELAGRFCHACGERVIEPADLRVGTFVRRAAAAAFDADSHLWLTLRLLLLRPGWLTLEFVRGRRSPYVHPLQTFLIVNLVLFLSLKYLFGFQTFTTQLRWHVDQPLYGSVARELVESRAPAGSEAAAEYARRFDAATPDYANSMIILMVPVVAAGIALLSIRRREPFVKHLVFALHFMAFLMLLSTLLPLVLWLLMQVFPIVGELANRDMPVSLAISTILSIWCGVGFWRAYGDRPWFAAAKGIAVVFMLIPALIVYRAILFFVVYYSLG